MPGETPHDDELSALAEFAGAEWQRAVTGIADTHAAIADRAFTATGPAAAPVRAAHDVVAAVAYGGVRAGGGALGRLASRVLATRERPDQHALSRRSLGATALGVLAGLEGDRLDGSVLAPAMSVRVDGGGVPLSPEGLAQAFPRAERRICVFLHGLMESEFAWGADEPQRATYGGALERECAMTPVYVRYNSGRHISENGRSLSQLLQRLVDDWPVAVSEIALVGHSMGGLVARSACLEAETESASWVRLVSHTVSLGTPHHGAPLPHALHYADAALHAVPETRAFGGLLRRRSAGIRDLRHASLVDEDWQGRDPDALRADAVAEVPLLEGARHYFVSASLTRSAAHPLGRLLGDALVLTGSAEGRSRRHTLAFGEEQGLRLGATHHLALLRHPEVRAQLCAWFATPAS